MVCNAKEDGVWLMKNWRPWVIGFISALVGLVAWFGFLEVGALVNGVPGDTLTAKFMEASCVGVERCNSPNADMVKNGVLALLAGIISLASWLIWHFYVEPVRYLKKHGKEIERS
jgi:hypothetical protein